MSVGWGPYAVTAVDQNEDRHSTQLGLGPVLTNVTLKGREDGDGQGACGMWGSPAV